MRPQYSTSAYHGSTHHGATHFGSTYYGSTHCGRLCAISPATELRLSQISARGVDLGEVSAASLLTDANTARRDLAAAQLRSGGRGIYLGRDGNLAPRPAGEIKIDASSSCFVTFELLSSPVPPPSRGAAPPRASTSAVALLGGAGDPSWRETLSLPLASPSPPSAPRRLRISFHLSDGHIGGDGGGPLLGSTEADAAL